METQMAWKVHVFGNQQRNLIESCTSGECMHMCGKVSTIACETGSEGMSFLVLGPCRNCLNGLKFGVIG